MHQDAEAREAERLALQRDSGIMQAFSAHVMINRKALIGALKMMYWLAKEEIAHTTKFASLMDLSVTPTDAQKQDFKSSIQVKYIQAIL